MSKDRTYTEKGTGPKGYDTTAKVGDRVLVLYGIHAEKEGLVTSIYENYFFPLGRCSPYWTVVLDDGKVLVYGNGYLMNANYAIKMRAIAAKLRTK